MLSGTHFDIEKDMNITTKHKNHKHLNLSDLEGNQGWWEDHCKSQVTPDGLEEEKEGNMRGIFNLVKGNERSKTVKTQKEGHNMKTIKETYLRQTVRVGLLVVGVLVLLGMPQITVTADAQGHANHIRTYHGMANLAEKELRESEREEKAKRDLLTVANVEKGHVTGRNETDSVARAELVEYKYSD